MRLRVSTRTSALLAIALSWLAWFVLVFAGYGGERSACPGAPNAAVNVLAVVCPLVATAGFLLAAAAYSSSASPPSSTWLLGAAGLYVTALAWIGTVTGGVALLLVDLCDLV